MGWPMETLRGIQKANLTETWKATPMEKPTDWHLATPI